MLPEDNKNIDNSTEPIPVVRVLDWLVDGDTCTLKHRISKKVVNITPRGMEVLMYLINHPARVVSANELLDLFWSRSVQADHAVHKVIAELRSALKDKACHPLYIKTYPKRGYALIAKPQFIYPTVESHIDSNAVQAKGYFAKYFPAASILVSSTAAAFVVGMFFFSAGTPEEAIQKKLLVLPFESVNVEQGELYLSNQMLGNLVSQLSKLPSTQIMVVQGELDDHRDTDYLLAGNIQQENEQYRVQVNLSDSRSDVLLFSDRFTLASDRVFNIQDEMVQHVASALRIFLDDDLRKSMLDWGTASTQAYDAFIKAEYYAKESNHASFRASIENYQHAIKQDADFANAYLGLATVANKMALYSLSNTNLEMRELVNFSLRELLRLDPNSQSTVAAQLLALRVEGNNQRLIEERLRELILAGDAPSFALSLYSTLLHSSKLYREAQEFLGDIPDDEEFKVSPDSTWDYRSYIATPENLISIKKRELLERPDHLGVLAALSRSYAFTGNLEKANYYLARMFKLDAEGPFTMFTQVIVSALYCSSFPEGDTFENMNSDNSDFNFSLGAKQFILGNISGGVEKWSKLNPSETRLLFNWLGQAELFFPEQVLMDDRYTKLLEELGIGKSWQRQIMEGVDEMSAMTGKPLSEQSTVAYQANTRLIRNNLWGQSEIDYPHELSNPTLACSNLSADS